MTTARLRRVRVAQERSLLLRERRLSARLGLPQDDADTLAYWRAMDAHAQVLGRPLTFEEAVAIVANMEGVEAAEILAEARQVAEEMAGARKREA